jgi:ABC-type phosphate transport system substrate-binding protein
MTRMTRFAVTFIVTAGGLLAARAASAQDASTTPTCASLTNPVYMDGSSAFVPTAAAFAVKLANTTETANKMTIVYTSPGSCVGVNDISLKNAVTMSGQYFTLDTTGKLVKNTCTMPTTGQVPDIGVSDVFYGSCGANVPPTQPATLKDFLGPVQAMELVVNQSNTGVGYLTYAEAQDLYGCGATADVASVFNQATGIFCRDQNSGTQIITCDNIGLSPASLGSNICVSETSSGNLAGAVSTFAMPTASVGFLGADVYDQNRTKLLALAFAAQGQTKAFFADSTSSARDRQNVRDGHYAMWGYEHMFAYVDTSGVPTSANAAKLINLILGTATDSNVGDYVATEGTAANGLGGTIPLCAMQVKKGDDLPGYLSAAAAPTCTCSYVKAATGTAPTGCVACGGSSDGGADAAAGSCTGGKTCQHGFCE